MLTRYRVFRAAFVFAALLSLACVPVHAQEGLLLYVPNSGSSNVSAFRTNADGSLTTVTTIGGFGAGTQHAVVRGDQAFAYVTSSTGDQVRVINTATNTVTQTVAGLNGATGVAIAPNGQTVYVATQDANTVTTFSADPRTGQLTQTGTITFAVNTRPRTLAFTPDGTRLVVANQGNAGAAVPGSVVVYDVTNPTNPTNPIVVGGPAMGQVLNVTINAAGTHAYVVDNSDRIHVVDLANPAAAPAVINTGNSPRAVAVSADGTRVYVTTRNDQQIEVYNAQTGALLQELGVTGASGVVLSPDGRSLYVTGENGLNAVVLFQVASGTGLLTAVPGGFATGTDPIHPGMCSGGNAMLATGATFVANSAAALSCAGANPTFTGGTLLVNAAGLSFSQAIALGTGGGTIDTNGNIATFSGVISGAGDLTKAGTGTLILSGANVYTGATNVNAGTLQAGAANTFSAASAVTVANGATLDLAGFNQTIASLAGAGSVTLGAGVLTAGGNNTSTTFSGVISGTGGLTHAGTGALNLTGANTYTGATTVNAGTLAVNGAFASPVTVNSGGTLMGTGTIGNSVSVASGGVFAPGNSIGTINVGSVTFAPGSIYRVEADPAGNADRINATGAAAINGGTVEVLAGAGTYQQSTQYTILSATGGVTGTFSAVTSNLAFLTPNLTYAPNGVNLILIRNDTAFGAVGQTQNQRAVGSYLDTVSGELALQPLITSISNLSAAQANAAFSSMSGESLTAPARVSMLSTINWQDMLTGRLGSGAMGKLAFAPIQVAQVSPSGIGEPKPGENKGVWLRARHLRGDQQGNDDTSGYDFDSVGLAGGFDTAVGASSNLGVAFSYLRSETTLSGGTGEGTTTTPQAALYGLHATGPWEFKGMLGFGRHDIDSSRHVTIGTSSGVATSNHKATEYSAYAEANYVFKRRGYETRTVMGLRYIYLDEDGYTEEGSAAPLAVDARTTESITPLLGLRWLWPFNVERGRVQLRAIYSYEAGDADAAISGRLAAASSGGTFTAHGAQVSRHAVAVGFGIENEVATRLSLYADYSLDLRSDSTVHALVAGVRYAF